MSARITKHQDEQDTMVTALPASTKRRFVRRRNFSSSLQQKILRVVSAMLVLSIMYLALTASLPRSIQKHGRLRGKKIWVRSDSQLFVSWY